jgi:nitrile hydratase
MNDHDGHEDHGAVPIADAPARVAAIEAVLTASGVITSEEVDAQVEALADMIGPRHGARIVARAWSDPAFRARLLDDAKAAAGELGVEVTSEDLAVVENGPGVHNVVVCTLCSCYPQAVLGIPPAWYKSAEYRARLVREPRAVLAEMGCALEDDVELRVWDSTAELRYLVLPERPTHTSELGEDQLADLVTRDSMIGVERL